jgi:hypothetical protein
MRHIDWRGVLARLPLPMLALAASYGVYSFALLFVPPIVAIVQAAAFELVYIGLAVAPALDIPRRRRAKLISAGAVVASVVYNTLAGWFVRQPQVLDSATATAWLWLAILHGAPLAWVAYLVADLLLHTASAAVAADAPQIAAIPDLPSPPIVAVDPARRAVYAAMLAVFDRDPKATTADLAAAAKVSPRTVESRRSELVKLGALHKTDRGYERNGVALTAAE